LPADEKAAPVLRWNTEQRRPGAQRRSFSHQRREGRLPRRERDGATLQVIYHDQGVGDGDFFDRLTGAFCDGVEANIYDA